MINWKLVILNLAFIIFLFVLMIACFMTKQYIFGIINLVSIELTAMRILFNVDDFIKEEEEE